MTAAPWVRRISRKSGSAAYLSSMARAIEPCSARAATACRRKVAIDEIVEDDVRGVGAGLLQGLLASLAVLDDQPQRDWAAADRFGQSGRRHVPQVAGHRLGPVGLQQFVDVCRR